jgi:polyribonucleotide nucleotidyltransferase
MLKAMELGHSVIVELCDMQEELRKLAGKEKLPLSPSTVTLQNAEEMRSAAYPLLETGCF